MMAAGRAGELGARAVLLEKNSSLGLKLLVTGNGRCNITNISDDDREFVQKFGKNGKFFCSSLDRFGPSDTVEFFEDLGVKTKIEEKGKVFPRSDRARDVLNALEEYLERSKVEVRLDTGVKKIIERGESIEKIVLDDGEEIFSKKYLIATGGKSYPKTGSTGDGYQWLKELGHSITELRPALVPIIVKNEIVKELEGVSLADVRIFVFKDDKKIEEKRGEAIFTRNGMSGPVMLLLSGRIGKELPAEVNLKIDLIPDLNFKQLEKKILDDFGREGNKFIKNYLDLIFPQKLAVAVLKLAKIQTDKRVNLISKAERKSLLHSIKELSFEVEGLEGYDRAVITSGGVKLNEIDPKTMKSKKIDNLYLAGEILDLDGPTGGYNLQMCWSTGRTAGESAAK